MTPLVGAGLRPARTARSAAPGARARCADEPAGSRCARAGWGIAPPLQALALALVVALVSTVACAPQPEEVRAGLAVAEAMGGPAEEGFARATEPRAFVFPADHGPHPGFRTEWWYFTGNLADAAGRRFGFQLTFFRNALAPDPPEPAASAAPAPPGRESGWATRHVHMAHFALTDGRAGTFHHAERFAREAAGLAGAQAAPFAVWLEDWSARGAGDDPFPLRLRAAHGGASIDLVLDQGRPPVLQGDAGLSRKGEEPGNASYYYSLTRMPLRGTVRTPAGAFEVTGTAWMDREWSTSALGPELAGWDWFALQLDDGRDLMFYRLRRKDGTMDRLSKGSLVAPDGAVTPLRADDVRLDEEGARWRSPHSGARYPARWRLGVPSHGIDLSLTPLIADQELHGLVVYWEGAVDVSGGATGRGYVEMTGYDSETARPR